MNDVNERIAQARKASGLNQNEVAEKLNLKSTTYSQMERSGNIYTARFFKIADILNTTVCDLYYGEKPCLKCLEESNSLTLHQPEPTALQKNVSEYTPKERSIIKILRSLSKANYAKTIKFIEDILQEEKNSK